MKLNGTQELFKRMGMSAVDMIEQMEKYISSLGLSLKLPTSIDVDSALHAVNLQRLANNPVKVTEKIISDLKSYLEKR